MKRPFVVIRHRGSGWDDSKALEGQVDWPGHADFMDALAADGFVLLAGPLEGTRDALLVVMGRDRAEVEAQFAPDPWTKNGLLVLTECWPWQLRLGRLP